MALVNFAFNTHDISIISWKLKQTCLLCFAAVKSLEKCMQGCGGKKTVQESKNSTCDIYDPGKSKLKGCPNKLFCFHNLATGRLTIPVGNQPLGSVSSYPVDQSP
ncbi:hypothetical protein QQ045_024929 [Rhodiola kirilowii]